MTILLKELKPKKPTKVLGFKLPATTEGLAEALQNLIGQLPIVVSERPVLADVGGISLDLRHSELGWALVANTGDWIVAGEDGTVEVYTSTLEDHFDFFDVLPPESKLKLV